MKRLIIFYNLPFFELSKIKLKKQELKITSIAILHKYSLLFGFFLSM